MKRASAIKRNERGHTVPFKTRVTELLGIEHPIMQGGIQNLATPELASAVSNAGGLGTINAATYPTPEELRAAAKQTLSLTDKPVCVNISMLPMVTAGERTEECLRAAVEAGVRIIETAGRNPETFVPYLKERGVTLIHKVPTVKHALKAQSVGADIVSIVGVEAAGHPGADEVPTAILANLASRALDIPIIAGGGVADGRGMAACLALGAEGVLLGTRFVAARECILHDNYKRWIVESRETDTVLIQKSIKNMLRAMKNHAAAKTAELEKGGATLEEMLPVISGRKGKEAQLSGDLDGGVFSIGQVVGLIRDIKSVRDIIDDIVREAEETIGRLNRYLS